VNVINVQLNFLNKSLDFKREVSCFVTPVNGVISITTDDSFGSVEFDFFDIWDTLKRNDPKAEQVYMLHSHPPGINSMSLIDENMVYGWRLALGVPIIYFVVTQRGIVKYICDRNGKERPVIKFMYFHTYHGTLISPNLYLLATVVYGLSLGSKPNQKDLLDIQRVLLESNLRTLK